MGGFKILRLYLRSEDDRNFRNNYECSGLDMVVVESDIHRTRKDYQVLSLWKLFRTE